MTANKELDFKSGHLFRTCYVVTNLVTSLQYNRIGCATILCHFGQTRSGSVATHFILLSSTATSSATGDYEIVRQHFGPNEKLPNRNEERTIYKPSFDAKNATIQCRISDEYF